MPAPDVGAGRAVEDAGRQAQGRPLRQAQGRRQVVPRPQLRKHRRRTGRRASAAPARKRLPISRWPRRLGVVQAADKAAPPAAAPFKDLDGLLKSLPAASPPALDSAQALWLATMPLACLDHPQAHPAARGYLWEPTYRPIDGYQKSLAFYGCFD